MKLVRHGQPGEERPGIIDAQGQIRDLGDRCKDFDPAFFAGDGLQQLKEIDVQSLPVVAADTRLGPCIAQPGTFLAIGLNYVQHAIETNAPIPTDPIIFSKAPSCVSGPNDPVLLPKGSTKTDWEVELAFVVGKRAHYVEESEALDYIAGYFICNDVSEREFQLERSGQWQKGKMFPTFGPIGPWLVTPDEVPDPQALGMWLDVNGEPRQRGNTSTMIFGVARIVSYVSRFMTLLPGDVICTGTPPGVGMGMKPPQFLKAGDVMSLGIEGLGVQRQTVR